MSVKGCHAHGAVQVSTASLPVSQGTVGTGRLRPVGPSCLKQLSALHQYRPVLAALAREMSLITAEAADMQQRDDGGPEPWAV